MCNHLCTAVDSVPYHKVFAGFGKSATLQYLNAVQVGAGSQRARSICRPPETCIGFRCQLRLPETPASTLPSS